MKRFIQTAILAVALLVASVAQATHEVNNITIARVYIDPTDIVVLTNAPNGCGSNFYHLSRDNTNFKEVFTFIFLAFKGSLPINFAVHDDCSGDRIWISHGSMGNG